VLRPVDDFEWYPVGKAVGNSSNQGQELIRPSDVPGA
jgi:putative SOS response-associated peptidase YedK